MLAVDHLRHRTYRRRALITKSTLEEEERQVQADCCCTICHTSQEEVLHRRGTIQGVFKRNLVNGPKNCGHSFCDECLNKEIQQGQRIRPFQCPACEMRVYHSSLFEDKVPGIFSKEFCLYYFKPIYLQSFTSIQTIDEFKYEINMKCRQRVLKM